MRLTLNPLATEHVTELTDPGVSRMAECDFYALSASEIGILSQTKLHSSALN